MAEKYQYFYESYGPYCGCCGAPRASKPTSAFKHCPGLSATRSRRGKRVHGCSAESKGVSRGELTKRRYTPMRADNYRKGQAAGCRIGSMTISQAGVVTPWLNLGDECYAIFKRTV